ncbi:spexin prohormone 2-like [Boleophthalmus pectinirostris]|uniref:spexin prohormone 2-like n=1 Tax=Boleophthalmus pectinirostris TaxID=150288 RepID=UPI00243246BF|nr:spexin prohormone 2-like [Boleophthalmus pectinirostris]
MRLRAAVVWTLTVIISLFVEVHSVHKMKIHWGPQSMMYLKGKHGRRFVSEGESQILKQNLQDWHTLLKGVQPVDFSKPRHIVSSEKILIQYLQER